MASFEDTYEAYQQKIEHGLKDLLPGTSEAPQAIHEAMHYCMEAGGKRLRPILVLAAAELYPRKLDPLAAAISVECLHTYSLVHDDLPCMDNSPLRRGKPSAHVQFDEATAVLAGDALLTEGFNLLARHYEEDPRTAVSLMRCLATAADSRHLIGGQVADTLSENEEISPEMLDFIHLHKTADLITACLEMGLQCTTAPLGALDKIREVGRSLGLAFQIVDDILDATSSSKILGKTVGNDARQAKNTYVSLHGLEASRERAKQETSRAIAACRALPDTDASFLESLINKLEFRIN